MEYENVYIHIGLPKAGSKYLQKNIFNHIDIDYLMLNGNLIKGFRFAEQFSPEAYLSELEKCIERKTHQLSSLLLSHELLSGSAEGTIDRDYIKYAERLKSLFPKAKILIVLRNQIDYMLSLYAFRVQNRGLVYSGIKKFLSESYNMGLKHRLEYDVMVEKYIELYGANNVFLFFLEELKANPDQYAAKVLSALGIENDVPITSNVKNASPKKVNMILLNRGLNLVLKNALNGLLNAKLISKEEHNNLRISILQKKRKINNRLSGVLNRYSWGIEFPDDFKQSIYDDLVRTNTRLQKYTTIDLSKLGYVI